MDTTTRAGLYYLAPATAPSDAYAAGYDANEFATAAEAEAAIPSLVDALGGEWVVGQYPGALAARLVEQGNGYPRPGAYVASPDQLYRVVDVTTTIHAGDARGAYVAATLAEVPWDACAERDVHPIRVELLA